MTLAEAQQAKYERLCRPIELGPGGHVLEIRCGWGSFARQATETYDCRVTGITISHEPAVVARERTRGLPVEILEQEYRTVDGTFTHVVSIEMVEAVGPDQFGTFFATIDRVLLHYDETLRRWRANVPERIDDVRSVGYDRHFERTWDFYLAFCEAGFRARALRDAQLLLLRPGAGA